FGVIAGGFAHGAFDRRNVGDLRADVKMNQFQTMPEAGVLQHLTRGDETRGVETELRVLAAARRPFAGTLAVQTHANPDDRFEADVFRRLNRLFELSEIFDDADNELAE